MPWFPLQPIDGNVETNRGDKRAHHEEQHAIGVPHSNIPEGKRGTRRSANVSILSCNATPHCACSIVAACR